MRRRRFISPGELIGAGATPEGANGYGMGIGLGLRVGSRAVWAPEKLVQPGDSWLMTDLDGVGGVTTAAQPVPSDWDMETAGTAAWTAFDATLSKQGSAYAGSQCLRVAKLVGNSPYTRQAAIYLVGCRYFNNIRARSNGAGVPRFAMGSVQADGTNSTDWQHLRHDATCAADNNLYLQSNSATAGQYSEFDALTGKNLSINQLTCKGNLGNLAQATAANMPWSSDADAPTSVMVNGKRVMYQDGSDWTAGPTKANTRFLHNGTGCTAAFVFRTALPVTAAFLFSTLNNGLSVGTDMYISPTGVIEYRVANALGAAAYSLTATSAAGAIAANTYTIIVARSNNAGGNIRKNGTSVATSGAPVSFSAGDATLDLRVGNYATGATPTFGIVGAKPFSMLLSRYITDAECLKLEAYLKAYYAL